MNLKNYGLLFITFFLSSICSGQYEKIKICDISNQYDYPISLENRVSLEPKTEILFYEKIGKYFYHVWLTNEYLGKFPDIGFAPKLDKKGNLFLPKKENGKKYLIVNGKEYGPFGYIEKAWIQQKKLIVAAMIPETPNKITWFINSKKKYTGSLRYCELKMDPKGNTYFITASEKSSGVDIYLNSKIVGQGVKVKNSDFSDRGGFLYFNPSREEKKIFAYVNGKKLGPLDGYWATGFDEKGIFQGRHGVGDDWVLFYGNKQIGPFKTHPKNLKSFTTGNRFLFIYKKDSIQKDFSVLLDGKEDIGPYEDFEKLHLVTTQDDGTITVKGHTYYYKENGIHKLGFEGKELGQAESKIIAAHKNGEHFIYTDRNENVYVNGVKIESKVGTNHNIGISPQGIPFYDYHSGIVANHEIINFDNEWHSLEVFNYDYSHYLLHSGVKELIIIDGKKFNYPNSKISVGYNEYTDSFHWLVIDAKEATWHSYYLSGKDYRKKKVKRKKKKR